MGDLASRGASQHTSMTDTIKLAAPADFHVHLRQGQMCELVAPHVAQGGVSLAYVMPNLVPPLTTTSAALQYRETLEKLCPDTNFLMTLFLSPELTVEEVQKAAKAGIKGVKSYPRGVTTNSGAGVESYERYYEVFEEMERLGLVLNLHGEVPSSPTDDISVLNAEASFLPHLHSLHARFPKLRIVLEHATSAAAVQAVKQCGPTVGCTITVHHLALTVDAWAGQPLNFCKPVAKLASDRNALRQAIADADPHFFLGSDSAPHSLKKKLPSAHDHVHAQLTNTSAQTPGSECPSCAAGIYSSSELLPLVAELFEDESLGVKIPLDRLEDYVSNFGRKFYQEPVRSNEQPLVLRRCDKRVLPGGYAFQGDDGQAEYVRPFYADKAIGWEIAR